MSDEEWSEEVLERRREARKAIAAAGQLYADTWDATSGSVITGYVFVVEMSVVGGGRYCLWLTGSGGVPDEENPEGLDSWRVEGLVRKVLRDLDIRNVTDE